MYKFLKRVTIVAWRAMYVYIYVYVFQYVRSTLIFDLVTTLYESRSNVILNVTFNVNRTFLGVHKITFIPRLAQRCGNVHPTSMQRCTNVIVLAGYAINSVFFNL